MCSGLFHLVSNPYSLRICEVEDTDDEAYGGSNNLDWNPLKSHPSVRIVFYQ